MKYKLYLHKNNLFAFFVVRASSRTMMQWQSVGR